MKRDKDEERKGREVDKKKKKKKERNGKIWEERIKDRGGRLQAKRKDEKTRKEVV